MRKTWKSCAVSELRWACTCAMTSVKRKASRFTKLRLLCQTKERRVTMLGGRSVGIKSGGSWSSRRLFEGSCGQHLAWSNSCSECGNVSPSGTWQHETVFKEELEHVMSGTATTCVLEVCQCAEHACNAVKSGDWENYLEEFLGNGLLSRWASAKVRECFCEVEQEDEGRLSIAQDILRKSTDFLRRVIAPVDEMEGVTLSFVCPHCHCFPEMCNWWCAACGGQCDWKAPNRVLVIQDGMNRRNAKAFRAHAAPQGICDNLINVLKLLANQQKDGDNLVRIVLENSRLRRMDGLRKFYCS